MRTVFDWPVWITLFVALTLGFTLQKNARQQTTTLKWEQSQFQIPAEWTIIQQDSSHVTVADRRGHGPFGPSISLHRVENRVLLPHGGGLWEAAGNWSSQQGTAYTGYRVLHMNPVIVEGKEGIRLECAFLQEIGANEKPGLMLSTEIIVPGKNHFTVWIFAAEEKAFRESAGLRDRLLDAWKKQENRK